MGLGMTRLIKLLPDKLGDPDNMPGRVTCSCKLSDEEAETGGLCWLSSLTDQPNLIDEFCASETLFTKEGDDI